MLNNNHTRASALSESELLQLRQDFGDSDLEDSEEIPLEHNIDYKKIMTCGRCGGNFQLSEDLLICDNIDCRMISERNYEDILNIANTHLVVKGISIEQRKQVYKELEIKNKTSDQVGVLPLPREVIDSTVDLFAQLKNCRPETRNKKRCQYLGSCIYLRCIAHGLMRSKRDIQLLCGLTDRNLTTTIGEIEMEINKGNIIVDSNYDIRDSNTNSICVKLKIPDSMISSICSDVNYILDVLASKMLVSSNFDAKILGAIFSAIRLRGFAIDLKYICNLSAINPETVRNVINIITDNMILFTRFADRFDEIDKRLSSKYNRFLTQKEIQKYVRDEVQLKRDN